MARIYRLKPTPADHPLRQRKPYHHLRAGIHDALKLSVPVPQDYVDLGDGTPPIENQGNEGACQSFQLRNVLMLANWLATGQKPTFDLSKAFAYYVARGLDGEDDADTGETIGNTLAGFEQYGICEETLMPYIPGQFTTVPSSAAYANALTHRYDLQAVPVDYSSWDNICDVLQDRRPLIGGFKVPPSFETCPANGILPDPSGEENLGGHAFSIDQLKRSDRWWRNPNSWSMTWGLNGFCYMPANGYLPRLLELWTFVPAGLVKAAS